MSRTITRGPRPVIAALVTLALFAATVHAAQAAPAPRAATPSVVSVAADAGSAQAARRQRAAAVISGYGAWVDLWDYSTARAGSKPSITPASIEAMHRNGVQVLYLQATSPGGPVISDPKRMKALIKVAKRHEMRVVLWYLPTTVNPKNDLRRLKALAAYPGIDAVAVDAEAVNIKDVKSRNDRLVALVKAFHAATPKPVITITPSPTAMALWAPKTWWPNYPFAALEPHSDAFMTMTYWQGHKAKGRTTAADQTLADITRLRGHLEDQEMPIHVIGSATTAADVTAFARVLAEQRIQGGSLYDWTVVTRKAKKGEANLFASSKALRSLT